MSADKKITIVEGAGCMSKLPAIELIKILNSIRKPQGNLILGGENIKMSDAERIRLGEKDFLISSDMGAPVSDNPKTAGEIAIQHCFNDIFVSGGSPMYVSLLIVKGKDITVEQLEQIMAGILEICSKNNVTITGGHTMVGEETLIGLTVIGEIIHNELLEGEILEGDLIMISKKLGTGIALRAFQNKLFKSEELNDVICSMLESNKVKSSMAYENHVKGITDVTGFGLLGHLIEIIPKDKGATLYRDMIPIFKSIKFLKSSTVYNKFIEANYNYIKTLHRADIDLSNTVDLTLLDPQTSGGILVIVAKELKSSFEKIGFSEIGKIRSDNRITVVNTRGE